MRLCSKRPPLQGYSIPGTVDLWDGENLTLYDHKTTSAPKWIPTVEKLQADEDVQEFYLGLHAGDGGEKKSFRDVKHYKRRKRWLS